MPALGVDVLQLVKGKKGMDDKIKAYCNDQADALTAGNVYCDLILTGAEATALQQLVKALRADGQHQDLHRVFQDIEDGIEQSRGIEGSDDPWRIGSGPSGV